MVIFSPCKINIGLNVISKRTDRFHDIETVFYAVPLNDIIEIIKRSDLKKDDFNFVNGFAFQQSGLTIEGELTSNLCYKAYQILCKEFNLPDVVMHLHKVIPMGAGLGGGSGDAAATLKLLNTLFDLKLTNEALINYASKLGSDCAFFIEAEPCFASGRGEVMHQATLYLRGLFITLIKPDVHVSTVTAYSLIKPAAPKHSIQELINLPIIEWKNSITNDFENPVFQLHPVLKYVKEKLYELGATFSLMSGSGSCIYAISDAPIDLKDNFKDCFVWQGRL